MPASNLVRYSIFSYDSNNTFDLGLSLFFYLFHNKKNVQKCSKTIVKKSNKKYYLEVCIQHYKNIKKKTFLI